eukprot:COSAG01_NODE_13606_length_1559_cov_6.980137_2_plen_71_part_00
MTGAQLAFEAEAAELLRLHSCVPQYEYSSYCTELRRALFVRKESMLLSVTEKLALARWDVSWPSAMKRKC